MSAELIGDSGAGVTEAGLILTCKRSKDQRMDALAAPIKALEQRTASME